MSDDLLDRLKAQKLTEEMESEDREHADFEYAHDCLVSDGREAAARIEELEAKVTNLTAHHSNPADPRYWEGRYRDEKARVEELEAALNDIREIAAVSEGGEFYTMLVEKVLPDTSAKQDPPKLRGNNATAVWVDDPEEKGA